MKNVLRVVAAVAVLTVLAPGGADAVRTGPRMYRLRLDGYVGPPRAGRREMADLLLRAGGETLRFQVRDAKILSGSLHAANVFSRVRPYRPNFILRGPRASLARVAATPKGGRLRIIGSWRPGSQDLMVSSVERRR